MPHALHWFHAFKRNSPASLLDALRHGCRFDPAYGLETQQNEAILKISPNCVYAYLGKTREGFGKNAVALGQSAVAGTVSPFDTGGVVAHMGPVCTWTDQEKRTYLEGYSWPADEITALLEKYPGLSDEAVRAYLAGTRPGAAGPHIVWGRTEPQHVADVWLEGQGGDERSYLWELRSPGSLPGAGAIAFWTCDTGMTRSLNAYLKSISDDDLATEVAELMSRFIEGGTGVLVERVRNGQEQAA